MLAPPRSKRPRSPSPPSSPSLNSPLELLIKRRRNERLQDQQGAGDVDEEWAGVEKRRNRMWERAQDPGPSRLPALDETEQSHQVNYLATPAPTLARASQQHHHHHQPSSSPIRPADGLPSYSPFGANALESSTSNTAVAYREPRGYFDLGTPGSPATGDLPSPSPFPAAWDSPYARSNALLHQLVRHTSYKVYSTIADRPWYIASSKTCWPTSNPVSLSSRPITPTTAYRSRYGHGR